MHKRASIGLKLSEYHAERSTTCAALEALAVRNFFTHDNIPKNETTYGSFDLLQHVDLVGQDCLDIGTFGGLFAFGLKLIGAANVPATDFFPNPSAVIGMMKLASFDVLAVRHHKKRARMTVMGRAVAPIEVRGRDGNTALRSASAG